MTTEFSTTRYSSKNELSISGLSQRLCQLPIIGKGYVHLDTGLKQAKCLTLKRALTLGFMTRLFEPLKPKQITEVRHLKAYVNLSRQLLDL